MARDYRKELTAWNSPENRKKRQGEYMEKHGPQKPRRKRLWPPTGKGPKKPIQPLPPSWKDKWKDKLKDIGRRFPRPKENLIEKMGGSEKAKPHSTREGRVAAGERRIRRILKDSNKPRPGRPGRPLPGPGWKRPENIMTPLRAKKGVGGILKKIVTKIKPKPKPKPKPKGKGLGSGIKPSEMHEIIPKKDRKLYLEVFNKRGKKAKGGPVRPIDIPWPKKRVKKRHGGSSQSHYLQHGYGPHKIQLRSGKPKIAKKGW